MRLAGAAAALVILFNACGSICLAENHDDMHGVNHPLVSIHLDGDPLQLSDDGLTELTFSFSVRGLLPGFTYNTVVHECDENGVPGRQSNHTVVSMDRDASSNEGMRDRQVTKCKMGLRVLDAKQIRYRLFIMVWDAHEVLPSREALVAQRDVTVSLVQDTGGRAGTASDKPKGAKQLGTTVPDSQDPGVTTANLSAVASRTSAFSTRACSSMWGRWRPCRKAASTWSCTTWTNCQCMHRTITSTTSTPRTSVRGRRSSGPPKTGGPSTKVARRRLTDSGITSAAL